MSDRDLGSDTIGGETLELGATRKMSEPPEERSSLRWVPLPGTLVASRYRVESIVGEGGMGAVVAATDITLNARVALKFLHPKLSDDQDASARFLREAQASRRIKSDHVVRVTDVGATEQGLPFIAMELLQGQDLEVALVNAPLPLATAVDCVLEAALALAEAHAVGIVHRDVKPANLWLARLADGTTHVKVLDFGISKVEKRPDGSGKTTSGALTQTQSVFGSPTYMSPEQIRSAKHVDFKTDVWSLGIVLFEVITRKRPFDGETVSAVLAAVAADLPLPIRHFDPRVPEPVERAIMQCLEKEPSRRLSLIEFAEAIRPYGTPVGRAAADRIAKLQPAPSVTAPAVTNSNLPPRVVASPRPGMVRLQVFAGGVLALGVVAIVTVLASGRNRPAVTPVSATHDPATTLPSAVPEKPPASVTPSASAPASVTPPPTPKHPPVVHGGIVHPAVSVAPPPPAPSPTQAPVTPPKPTSSSPISEERQ